MKVKMPFQNDAFWWTPYLIGCNEALKLCFFGSFSFKLIWRNLVSTEWDVNSKKRVLHNHLSPTKFMGILLDWYRVECNCLCGSEGREIWKKNVLSQMITRFKHGYLILERKMELEWSIVFLFSIKLIFKLNVKTS